MLETYQESVLDEQERQAWAKKKKKNRVKKRVALCLTAVLVVGGIWYAGWGRNMFNTQEETTVTIQVGAGQSVIYASLDAVRGNEITYTVAQEMSSGQGEAGNQEAVGEQRTVREQGTTGERGTVSEQGTTGNREAVSGQKGAGRGFRTGDSSQSEVDGQGADGTNAGGQMPSRGGMPSGGEMPSGDEMSLPDGMTMPGSTGTAGSSATAFTYNNVTYQLTKETVTTQIPVGTDVTTRLGTVTTFSRLAAGDLVALVVQEVDGQQVIMSVYIIG